MIQSIFHTVIYQPLYNVLVFCIDTVPGHDVGLAVIAVTIIVRLVLYPLSQRAIQTQRIMKDLVPEVEQLKNKFKDKKEEEAKAIFALYREKGVHPFAGIGLVLLQLPILLGLYWVFTNGELPAISAAQLYPFVHAPEVVKMTFLGIFDMAAKHNVILAILAGLSQAVYTRLSMGPVGKKTATEASLSSEMARSFDIQARYVLPVLIAVISYSVTAAAPLYWATSNLAMIAQEYLSGRRFYDTQ